MTTAVLNVRDGKGGLVPLLLNKNADNSYSLSVVLDADVTIPSNVGIIDGADVVEGHLADVASGVDSAGTLSAKLRQLTKQLPAALVVGNLPVALYDSLGNAFITVIPADGDAVGRRLAVAALGRALRGSDPTKIDSLYADSNALRVALYDNSGNALVTIVPADGDAVGRRLAVSALARALRSTDVTKIDSILADINALRVSLAAKNVVAGDKLLIADAAGNLSVTLGTKIAGEDLVNDRVGTYVKPVDSDAVLETLQNAATGTGNGTSINMRGYKSMTLEIAGTFVGTVTFESRIDTNWYTTLLTKVTDGTTASTATAAGLFTLPGINLALQDFRARISAYTSGSITAESRKHPR